MFVPSLGVETEGNPPTSRNDLLGVVGPELKAGGSPNVSTQHVGVVGSMATHRDWILVMKIRKKKKNVPGALDLDRSRALRLVVCQGRFRSLPPSTLSLSHIYNLYTQ